MKSICFVATVPAVIQAFLKTPVNLAAVHWNVDLISNPKGAELLTGLNAKFIPVAVERKISPWRDLWALISLYREFRRSHYRLVHSIMPKTGLLTMIAGWAAGIPHRLHTFTGQVWATKRGAKREILKCFDRIIVLFATQILVDSPSQRDFLVSEKIIRKGQAIVLGHGSICGVDGSVFKANPELRNRIRNELKIEPNQMVILFLGRLTREKGILDLVAAFTQISRALENAVLVLVGAEEDITFAKIEELCGELRHLLRRVDYTAHPEHYMAIADIFCLPSYREGFGQVIIEAAATGVPTVATRIYGITDAVSENETGLLYSAGNVTELTDCLLTLLKNEALRHQLGQAARERALKLFSNQKISEELIGLYHRLLTSNAV